VGLTRREAIKIGVFGTGALVLPAGRLLSADSLNRMAASALPLPYSVPLAIPPVLAPVRSTATTDYFQVTMQAKALEILPGYQTTMLTYDGIVPGPTISVRRGRKSVVRFINALPAKHPTFGYQPDTSVHLHGSASLPQFDGYANDITRPGQYKDYQFPNLQESRNLWYHDHAAHKTARNVYSGLAGFYCIHDELEDSLPLPRDQYDVPLMITDAMFTNTGQLLWIDDHRLGMNGDVILVNGRPWPVMQVERRKYRFRILVASVSRDYRWKLDSGEPFTIVGTDAGLLEYPQSVNSFRHGNAERYDVVIDFANYPIGTRVQLLNMSNPNNIAEANTDKVMAFDVVSETTSTEYNSVPDVMNVEDLTMKLQPTPTMPTRIIDLVRTNGEWMINGKRWEDVEASRFKSVLADVPLGATEIWDLRNDSGGWHHPMHIHLVDVKILDRRVKLGAPVPPMPYELGPKDVIYLGENERVRVIATFGPHSGRYMMHCHNLVHEDHSMMGQFRIVGPTDPDPITTARPRNMPAPPL
jgi:spore coat protein A, manganese oxidase